MENLEEGGHKALSETVLSNSEIARRCGVVRSTVALWKNGHTVRSNNLAKLCLVLDIHDDVLAALEKLLGKLE